MEILDSIEEQLRKEGLESSDYNPQLLFNSIELNIQLTAELNRRKKLPLDDKERKDLKDYEELITDTGSDFQLLPLQVGPPLSLPFSTSSDLKEPKPKENETKMNSETQHAVVAATQHNQSIFSIQNEMSNIKKHLQYLATQFLNPGTKTVVSIMDRYLPMVASLHTVIQLLTSEKLSSHTVLNKTLIELTPRIQILANEILELQNAITQNTETNLAKQDQLHIDTIRCFASLAKNQTDGQLALQRQIEVLPKAIEAAAQQTTTQIGTQLFKQFLLQEHQRLSLLETNLAKGITKIEDAIHADMPPKQILTDLKNILFFDAKQPGSEDLTPRLIPSSMDHFFARQLQPFSAIDTRNMHAHPIFSRINLLLGYLAVNRWIQPEQDLANPSAWIKIANLAKTTVQKNLQFLQQEPTNIRPLEYVYAEGQRLFNFLQKGNLFIQKIGAQYVILLKKTLKILKIAQTNFNEAQTIQNLSAIKRELEKEATDFSNMPAPLYDNPTLRKIEDKQRTAPSEIIPTKGVIYAKSKIRFRGQISPLSELNHSFKFNYNEYLLAKKQKAAQIIQQCALSIRHRAQHFQKGIQTRSQVIYPELHATDKFTVLLLIPNEGFPIDPELINLDSDFVGKVVYRYSVNEKQLVINVYFRGPDPSDEEHLIYRLSKEYKDVLYLDNDVLFDIWYGGRYCKLQDTFELLYKAQDLSLSSVEMASTDSFVLVSPHLEKDSEEEVDPSSPYSGNTKETDNRSPDVEPSIVKGFKQNTLTSLNLGHFPPQQEYDPDREEFVETTTIVCSPWTLTESATSLATKSNEQRFYQALDLGILAQSTDLSYLFQKIDSTYTILEAACYLFYGELYFSHASLEFIRNNVVVKTEAALTQLVKTSKADGPNLATELRKSQGMMNSYLDKMDTLGLQPYCPSLEGVLKDLEIYFKSCNPNRTSSIVFPESFSPQPSPPALALLSPSSLTTSKEGAEAQILQLQAELKKKMEIIHRQTQEIAILQAENEAVKTELENTKALAQTVTTERNKTQIALMNMENAKDIVQANLNQLAKLFEASYAQLHQQVTNAISQQQPTEQLIALEQILQEQQAAHQKLQQPITNHTTDSSTFTPLLNQQQSSNSQIQIDSTPTPQTSLGSFKNSV